MKCFTDYQRFSGDTINGEMLVIAQRYSTFDAKEMDRFEGIVRATIGDGIMAEIDPQAERSDKE